MDRITEEQIKQVSKINWKVAKVNAWSGSLSTIRAGEPFLLDIRKETDTFIWVCFYGDEFRLRKTDFFYRNGISTHIWRKRPFKAEFELVKEWYTCEHCKEFYTPSWISDGDLGICREGMFGDNEASDRHEVRCEHFKLRDM